MSADLRLTDSGTRLLITQLIHSPVVNPAGDRLGRVQDVIVRPGDSGYPKASGLSAGQAKCCCARRFSTGVTFSLSWVTCLLPGCLCRSDRSDGSTRRRSPTWSKASLGSSLGGAYFGLSPYVGVPIAALVLIGISLTGNFRRWERAMFIFRARNLLVFPLALFSHPDPEQVLRGLFIPGIAGGVTSNAVLPVIAIIGTTLAPWQLYFQQSNVLDKRITPRWLAYERADTVIGLAWW